MNPTNKFLVCLFSEPNFLAVNILENLLANNCFVNIVTDNENGWAGKTTNIVAKNRFNIGNVNSFQKDLHYGYFIFCSGFLDKEKIESDLKLFLKTVNFQSTKTFFVFPKDAYGIVNFESVHQPENLGIIYLGDVLGPRMDLESNLKLPVYLNQILNKRILSMPIGETLYPVFVSDVARQIVKWLFAFGPFGKEIMLLGPDVSTNVFWQTNTKLIGEIKYTSDLSSNATRIPKNIDTYRISKDLNFSLSETYRWINLNPHLIKKIKNTISTKNSTPINKTASFNKIKAFFLPLAITLLLPVFTLIVGGMLTYFSYQQFKSGHDKVASNLLYANKAVSNIGYFESRILRFIPLMGQLYKETEYSSYVLINISNIGISGIPLARMGAETLDNVLEDSPYSVTDVLQGSHIKMQQIANYLAILEKKSLEDNKKGSFLAKYTLSKINFEKYKNLVLQTNTIVENLPNVLGMDQRKTYLILFQNNMELRPTGGFIGSFGLLTFDKGRLSEFTINDVYSADGQLNGHVEPPTAIREHLGEANWWLRDSNWDPDFPTSAKRAEWFLDKEIDRKVDGVVSVDLYPIKNFLEISGPILLTDYDTNITSSNLYEKVQSEVQENFFPGTHKKASFLTALSRSILNQSSSLPSSQKVALLELIYKSLNERHVQLFLHDSAFQTPINNLGWDGSVFTPKCEGVCFSDLVGIVEANVGMNKSNYFINRSVAIKINIKQNVIEKTLTLNLENKANKDLGVSGRYKSYVRLLVPEGSSDILVQNAYGQNLQTLTPDITNSKGRKEVGVVVEILAGESKKLTFFWSNGINQHLDYYSFYYRKQAGVDAYPITIDFSSPINILGSNPVFSLTDEGNYLYNTTLVQDLFVKFSL